jgi:polyhydroxybutyrate depolymerase
MTSYLFFSAVGLVSIAGVGFAESAPTPAASTNGNQTAATAPSFPGLVDDETIKVGDQTREYRLLVPPKLDLSKPAPLVFAFHGMGEDNMDHMSTYTGLDQLAMAHQFILVYPGAAVNKIPAGLIKAWAMTPEIATADLAFFDALLARLKSRYKIDVNAIYVTGMSNGAYFANLVGRERSDEIAAVAAHSSELGVIDLTKIATGRKFPVMLIHGDADPIFPVAGARQARDIYQKTGHEVKYVEVPGLGHAWASAININDQIWDFFRSHPLNAPLAAPAPVSGNLTPAMANPAPVAGSADKSSGTGRPGQ